MTALVCYFAGVLIGLAVVLIALAVLPAWREANRRLDEQLSDALAEIDFDRWENGK